jgi:hypothetical protein
MEDFQFKKVIPSLHFSDIPGAVSEGINGDNHYCSG